MCGMCSVGLEQLCCHTASMSVSDVLAGTCVEEEGKGRGFLPSPRVIGDRRARPHQQRKGFREAERAKRGERRLGKEGRNRKCGGAKVNVGKKEEEGRPGEGKKKKTRQQRRAG